MVADFINGSFELVSGILVWLNVRAIYRDKTHKGVHLLPLSVFTIWGYWNMYYYPSLNQMCSLIGGIMVALANTVWVVMIVYYKRQGRKKT